MAEGVVRRAPGWEWNGGGEGRGKWVFTGVTHLYCEVYALVSPILFLRVGV